MVHTIFVSHAYEDNKICDLYVNELKKCGFDIWYDRENNQAGNRLESEIEKQLRKYSALLIMLSDKSVEKAWVIQEVDMFRILMRSDKTKLMLPVLIAPCKMPLSLQTLVRIEAIGKPLQDAIHQIVDAVGANRSLVNVGSRGITPTKISRRRSVSDWSVELTLNSRHTIRYRILNDGLFNSDVRLDVDGDEVFRRRLPLVGGIFDTHKFYIDNTECKLIMALLAVGFWGGGVTLEVGGQNIWTE